jgi:ABC-type transport system involved in multi-copper enzyme maturation permease subunit
MLTAKGPTGVEYPMLGLLGNIGFWLIFWVIPPLLTMRLFAEERSSNTLEMLMTAPLTDGQVVRAKFAACYLFYLLLLLPTLIYLPALLDVKVADAPGDDVHYRLFVTPWTISMSAGLVALAVGIVWSLVRLGPTAVLLILAGLALAGVGLWGHQRYDPVQLVTLTTGVDPNPAVTSYLGLALAGAMFLAIGLWVSSLVRSQIVAALISLALSLVFLLGGLLVLGGFLTPPADTAQRAYRLMTFLSVPLHFSRDFGRGLIDTRHVVLYVSVTLACLFLTVRSVEGRRWA